MRYFVNVFIIILVVFIASVNSVDAKWYGLDEESDLFNINRSIKKTYSGRIPKEARLAQPKQNKSVCKKGVSKRYCKPIKVQGLDNVRASAVDTSGNLGEEIPSLKAEQIKTGTNRGKYNITGKNIEPVIISAGEELTLAHISSIILKSSKKGSTPKVAGAKDDKKEWVICTKLTKKTKKECKNVNNKQNTLTKGMVTKPAGNDANKTNKANTKSKKDEKVSNAVEKLCSIRSKKCTKKGVAKLTTKVNKDLASKDPKTKARAERFVNKFGGGTASPAGGSYTNSQARASSQKQPSAGGGSSKGIFGSIGKLLGKIMNKPKQAQKPKQIQKPKPSCRMFTASEQSITPGESTTLSWALAYSEFASITPGVGSVPPRGGSVQVSPSRSTTYTLQTQNRQGYASCPPVRITVLAKRQDEQANHQVVRAQAPQMSCSPSAVAKGGTGIVLWQCPSGTVRSVGSSTEYKGFNTGGKITGSARVRPSDSSTFVVRCRDASNREIGRGSCKMSVGGAYYGGVIPSAGTQQARSALQVSKQQVQSGEKVTIQWQGYNTTSCIIRGPDGFTEQGNKGSVTGRMLQTSTFSLDCKSGGNPLPLKEATITVI